MSLRWKLFFSYLVVIAVPLLIMVISTAYVAPVNFTHEMMGAGRGMMMRGHRQEDLNAEINAQLEATFRQSLNKALWQAGAAAILSAAGISWLISLRLTRLIRALVSASHRIADGHYEERLSSSQQDELGDLIHSFNQMAATLAATETLRQQLIGDVTHELKTPLASIKGYMEGLQDQVIPATPETYQLIHREADRLQRLVQDLQELSRVEAGQISLNRQPCALPELITAAIQRLQPQYTEKAITLTCTYPPTLPPVYADADRVIQVMVNLLGNALQYTPAGGTVQVQVMSQPQQVQVAIVDSGIGLEAADLKRIFQRFYRVDKSRARRSGGSGIGLTIARHLIEAQGGQLWAASAGLGRGSTFSFSLPKLHTGNISA